MHWNGNDAFLTAFANALSMSFPEGEQFFVDAVKAGLGYLPQTQENESLRIALKMFIGQESTHRHLHKQINLHLEKQGYQNLWGPRIKKNIAKERQRMVRKGAQDILLHELALTCAVEHFTAILGDLVLSRIDQEGDWFLGAAEPLKTLWHWHCAEESEHKSIAFELFTRLGGSNQLRLYWYRRFLTQICIDLPLQVTSNILRDGSWKKWRTWQSGVRFVFGAHGLVRSTWPSLCGYWRKDFHPQQYGSNTMAQHWLAANQVYWSPAR